MFWYFYSSALASVMSQRALLKHIKIHFDSEAKHKARVTNDCIQRQKDQDVL